MEDNGPTTQAEILVEAELDLDIMGLQARRRKATHQRISIECVPFGRDHPAANCCVGSTTSNAANRKLFSRAQQQI